ncbi:MAG TPA: hypothetical protein VJK30_03355 [Coxiellaceae bacterium]|nr:MAG: hypothetical protein A3E81_03415 [Gammaproteobacteria bacterium RIFCSPHIGHO2_12_FULL_36_30]HLB56351.1 hypothetical protein [Coxiellaceae bacterium]
MKKLKLLVLAGVCAGLTFSALANTAMQNGTKTCMTNAKKMCSNEVGTHKCMRKAQRACNKEAKNAMKMQQKQTQQ